MDAATSISLALRRKQVAFWAQKSLFFVCVILAKTGRFIKVDSKKFKPVLYVIV